MSPRTPSVRIFALPAALAVLLVSPFDGSPQTSPTPEELLSDITLLATTGRTEEARAQLADWWSSQRGEAMPRSVERALWWRARLQTDPLEATRDFRRLLVEYPSGPYADLALLRLVQGARASGDSVAEENYLESLARGYPGSPGHQASLAWARGEEVRLQAAVLMDGRFDVVPGRLAAAPALDATDDMTASTSDAEMGGEGLERSDVNPKHPPPEADSGTEAGSPAGQPAARYAVQLGAFREISRAERLMDRAVERGLEVRIVRLPESELHYVRVGKYGIAAEADELQVRLTELGFRTFVVRDAHEERPAR